MSNRTTRALFVITLSTLALPSSSFAQSSRASPRPESYEYVFPDDPLDAGFFSADDVHIRVLPMPKRSVLIRPRVQFVTEMLKSVETL
jgi:hypothetical protein